MHNNHDLSRRKILVSIAAGCALATQGNSIFSNAEVRTVAAGKWPWPYVKLDPADTAELAYHEWYRVFCGGAVISSVFSQLREKVGEPYRSFPVDAFVFLEGGIAGWGTICGSNAGANIVSNLIIGPRIADSDDGVLIGSEVMQWYSDAQMPVYTPKVPRFPGTIPKTKSDSPLCHISVGRWMKAAGKPLKSPERRHRCASVAASVAYRLVDLLNAWHEDKYDSTVESSSAIYGVYTQGNCADCHGSSIPTLSR